MAGDYTADGIEILTLREAVRKRPAMYIGPLGDGTGPLNLLLELVTNAMTQVLLGRCTRIDVHVDADDFITVVDDGPGIPAQALVDMLEQPSATHRVLVPFGLRGFGLSVANVLSDPFEVDTVHAGEQAIITYAGGLQRVPLRVGAGSRPSGTRVRFRPDPQIFPYTRVPRIELTQRLEDLAFLLPAMALSWSFAGEHATGLGERVRAAARGPIGEVAQHRGDYSTEDGPVAVEVALAWRTEPYGRPAQIDGFANFARTEEGPHVSGLLAGVLDFLRDRDDRRPEGLVAAVAVRYADDGIQTKVRLASSGVYSAVTQATLTALQRWAERFPEAADEQRRRVKAREAGRSADRQPERRRPRR